MQFVLDSFGSDDLVVFLPDGRRLGDGYTPDNAVDLAVDGAIVARIDGGILAVVPVTFQTSGARLVVTAFVSNADLREGVATSWLILAILGLIVVLGAVPLADRLAAGATQAHARAKALLNRSLQSSLEDQLEAEAQAIAAWLCSRISILHGQPFSTASRRRCSEPTPGLPPQEKMTFLAQPAPIIWS